MGPRVPKLEIDIEVSGTPVFGPADCGAEKAEEGYPSTIAIFPCASAAADFCRRAHRVPAPAVQTRESSHTPTAAVVGWAQFFEAARDQR
jgi:hypothetical protein